MVGGGGGEGRGWRVVNACKQKSKTFFRYNENLNDKHNGIRFQEMFESERDLEMGRIEPLEAERFKRIESFDRNNDLSWRGRKEGDFLRSKQTLSGYLSRSLLPSTFFSSNYACFSCRVNERIFYIWRFDNFSLQ